MGFLAPYFTKFIFGPPTFQNFNFIAFLSINLAILNLLPIPALDGGQLFILGVEGIIRRPLSLRQRMVWQQVGMAILAFIMVFVIVNDISRILR